MKTIKTNKDWLEIYGYSILWLGRIVMAFIVGWLIAQLTGCSTASIGVNSCTEACGVNGVVSAKVSHNSINCQCQKPE